MLSADDINNKIQTLTIYRRNVAHLLDQAALLGGQAFAPPELYNHLYEARREIARIKETLRHCGVSVEDHPDDTSPQAPANSEYQAPSLPKELGDQLQSILSSPVRRSETFSNSSIPADSSEDDVLLSLIKLRSHWMSAPHILLFQRLLQLLNGDDQPGESPTDIIRELLLMLQQRDADSGLVPVFTVQLCLHGLIATQDRSDWHAVELSYGPGHQPKQDDVYTRLREQYDRVLEDTLTTFGPIHPETIRCYNNVGALLQAQGDYDGARACYKHVYVVRKETLGEDHADTARSLNNLALVVHLQGDYSCAKTYYENALAIRQGVLESNHPEIAQSLHNLGMLLHDLGFHPQAQSYYKQALDIQKEVLGWNHLATAQSLNNVGTLLQAHGNYSDAHICYQQALKVSQYTYRSANPVTATYLNNLGTLVNHNIKPLVKHQSNLAQIYRYAQQALDMREHVLGPTHLDTAQSLHNVAVISYVDDRLDDARQYLSRAFAIRNEVLGDAHPMTYLAQRDLFLLEERGG